MVLLRVAAVLLVLGGAACGGVTNPSPTARPATPTASVAPTPTATPAPDTDRVDVVSAGVGTWQLVTVPVAVVHSAATHSMVSGLLVHLTPTRGGRPLTPTVTPALILYPGESLVVAANCTDTCTGADGATATVSGGTWGPVTGAPPSATTGAVHCTVSCQGHGQWDVPVTVAGSQLVQNEQVDLFAQCLTAAGTVLGGGQRTLLWPQSGGSLMLDIPVIVNAPPATCQVGVTTSN